MKVKTSEATGPALNWAVASALGDTQAVFRFPNGTPCEAVILDRGVPYDMRIGNVFHPSTDWAQGGPIIEREGISLRPIRRPGHELDGQCLAAIDHGNTGTLVQWVKRETFSQHYWKGPTALIAAMRCFVASRLGDEVDVPEELCK